MVHLVRNNDNKVIGWEMRPTTDEEQEIAAFVRDLQFFGFEDTRIVYNGLKLIDKSKGKAMGNIESLSWVQKIYER